MKKNWLLLKYFEHKRHKICCVMRWCIVFTLLFSFSVSARVVAQQEKINLNLSGVTLKMLFQEIQKQTGFSFVYNEEQCGHFGGIDIKLKDGTVRQALDQVFWDKDLTYFLEGKIIVVKKGNKSAWTPEGRKITGRVTDTKGEPLPGVGVMIKGTTYGVITDPAGNYSLEVTKIENLVLRFSFVGMKAREISVSTQNKVDVVLEEDVQNMDEVVVTGYFNKSKESFTGSEVSVKGEELKRVGALNVIQALNAFDPSIRLAENLDYGSDPNRVPEITIRGENGFDLRSNADDSRTNPNRPLYILDGVEVSATRVYDMDMNRIDQMTILKDASATALYGSRGANGVIVITTLRPTSGEIKISATANYNVSIPDLRDYNLMNAEEKLEFERLAGVYTAKPDQNNQYELDEQYNRKLEEVRKGVNTYWLSQPLQRSVNQRYSVNFEGGDKNFRYGIDLRYDRDKGVMIGSGRQKYGIGVIFNYNIGSNFFIRNDVMVDNMKSEDSPYGSFEEYARQNPYDRIYDENGDLNEVMSTQGYNPLINSRLPNFNQSGYVSIQDNFNIDWRIIESLRLQGRFSYTKQQDKTEIYISPSSIEYKGTQNKEERGSYSMGNGRSDRFDGNLTASFYKNIGRGTLNVGVGTNILQNESESDRYVAAGFVSDKIDFIGAATGYKKDSKPTASYDKSRLIGFFGNVNYGFDNRYFLDMSYRTDGSSKFGRNSRFAPFWSVGIAWNAHKEKFWQGDSRNSLKIRASIGATGSTNFSSSQAQTSYKYDFNKEYNNYYGAILLGYGNPDLKWQKTDNYNVGVDFTFLQGRVTLNADGYIKKTQNLLSPVDVVPSTGFLDYIENVGELKNVGLEGRLRVDIIRQPGDGWRWNVTLAAFHNSSKVTRLSGQLEKINASALKYGEYSKTVYRMYDVGRSQSAIMLVRSAGIDPATGNEVFLKPDGTRTFTYDHNDRIVAGDEYPDVEGTINSNLTWRGFNLYMQFRYKWGGQVYNSTLATRVEGANVYKNTDRRALYDRWKQPGDIVPFRRIDTNEPARQTTRMLFDDNLFSMESLSLTYDLPLKYAKMIHMQRVRAQVNTSNLFRLSSVKQERGLIYPFARTFSAGLSLTF